jgi:hypothetical protein
VDPRQNAFQVVVYENNNGVPGNVLYESDSLFTPRFSSHNEFIPYPLLDGPFLPNGSYFIGVKQRDAVKLNIGFDRNNIGLNQIVYGNGSSWYPTIFDGTLLMRPYFRYQPSNLRVERPRISTTNLTLYPNPTRGELTIGGLEADVHYQIFDLQGRVVQQGIATPAQPQLDLHGLPAGTYFMVDTHNRKPIGRIIIHP